jgi:drug/metabolite transporter (DMT)-like permease
MALWHRYSWLAYLAVFVGVLGHASTEFFAVLSGIGGPELSVWRFILGSIGLVIVALMFPESRDLIAPFRTHGWHLLGISLLGFTFGYLVFHWSLDFASIPQVATVVTTIPIFVALATLVINNQKVSLSKAASGACAIIGITLLITDGYLAKLGGSTGNLLGIFLALACAAAVASYSVLIRPLVAEFGALRITAISMVLGAIGLWVVVGLVFGIWATPDRLLGLEDKALASLLTIAFWNTTITQFLWIGGLAAVPDITRGSYLFFLKPVIAAGLAVLILSQPLTTTQILAIIVITASVAAEFLVGKFTRKT